MGVLIKKNPHEIVAFIFLWNCCESGLALLPRGRQHQSPTLAWRHGTWHLFGSRSESDRTPVATKGGRSSDYERVKTLTAEAIRCRGKEQGFDALIALGEKCQERRPFDFERAKSSQADGDGTNIIEKFPNLLSPETTRDLFQQVEAMVQKGWLSTNADSVDSLPSFHLNLVSGGKPVPVADGDGQDDEFQKALRDLLELVGPPIYNQLLPFVCQKLGSNNLQVDDIFVRRYGQDVIDGMSRNGISAHYDVYSRVTSVIALDDVASKGRNGLYTAVKEESSSSRHTKEMGNLSVTATSNHASLRRFFPLRSGDAVVHTWDVLHGVDVEPGIDRSSLIVWFTEKQTNKETKQPTILSPWLLEHKALETDNVAQFVLASALESSFPRQADSSSSSSIEQGSGDIGKLRSVDFYLESANGGNSFAMTRLGSICETGQITQGFCDSALHVLRRIQPEEEILELIGATSEGKRQDALTIEEQSTYLSRRFWYQGALTGNPLAQTALADDLMAMGASRQDIRLLAATLFGIAAQQGHQEALEALMRVVAFEAELGQFESEEEFLESPVVQTAQLSMIHQ